MIVEEKEYKEMWKQFDGMTFTPLAELITEKVTEEDDSGIKSTKVIFKYDILKTADEVYQEYLNPPKIQQGTEQQVLNAKLLQQNAEILLQLEEQKNLNAQILLQIAGGAKNV